MRKTCACLAVFLLSGCLNSTFTPECLHPDNGRLANVVWGGVQPGSGKLFLLNADLEEAYCTPFVSVYKPVSGKWQFEKHANVPKVNKGTPSLPLAAGFADDGSLWIGERRGQRLLHLDAGARAMDSVDLGLEPALLKISTDSHWLFAADATDTRIAVCDLTQTSTPCRIEALQTDAKISALAVSGDTLWLAYQGGSFLSRWQANLSRWLPLISPGAAQVDLASTSMDFDSAGNLILALPGIKRLARLLLVSQYQTVEWSETIGLPARLQMFGQDVLVHDRLYGDWWLDASLEVTGAVQASPTGVLQFWASGVGVTLGDKELQQW